MSRSRQKSKFTGYTTAVSEKEDKRLANRAYRKAIKQGLQVGKTEFPQIRELSNVWCSDKDGKHYYSGMSEKDMRK
jgi:hypothetical protein